MYASIIKLFCLAFLVCEAVPKQVIIVRHAERYNTGPLAGFLTPQGLARAQALGSYLTQIDESMTNPPLFVNGLSDVIFAARQVEDGSNNTKRCLTTINSAATILHLPIHAPWGLGQEEELVHFIMTNPLYDEKNILICWHHPKIHRLIELFGYEFPYESYPGDRFDFVWLLNFPAPVPAQVVCPILQELMYWDCSPPPPPPSPCP